MVYSIPKTSLVTFFIYDYESGEFSVFISPFNNYP